MRFINVLSYRGADFLMKQMKENHDKRRIYYYGFQVVIGGIIKAVLLLILALITGTVAPVIMVIAFFSTLRVIAGGYHMDTFGRCTIVSIVLFIAIAWISQNTYHIWSQGALIIFAVFSFILTLIILIKRAPVSNHNRQISSKEEIEKFRRLFKMYMFLWAVAVCILFMLDLKMFVLTASLAILLEAFLISKPGHNFFSFINDGFSIAGK